MFDVNEKKVSKITINKKCFSIYQIQQLMEEFKNFSEDEKKKIKLYNLTLDFEKYEKDEFKTIKEFMNVVKDSGIDPSVIINSDEMDFSKEEMENFVDFEDDLKQDEIELYFGATNEYYDLNQVLSAHNQLELFEEKIKKTDASPLEKYLMIYNYLTSKAYKEADNRSDARSLISIMNSDQIVCVGYARLMKKICNDCGIECEVQTCELLDRSNKNIGWHMNNLVYLKDEKYGVDGLFYADACWDSVERGRENKKSYNFCLIPLSDKDKMSNCKIDIVDSNIIFHDIGSKYNFISHYSSLIPEQKIEFNDVLRDVSENTNKDFENKLKRSRACSLVKNYFVSMGIPGNVYYALFDESVSLECLIALAMNVPESKNELISRIKKLKDIYCKQWGNFAFDPELYKDTIQDGNVYDEIERIKKLDFERYNKGTDWAKIKKYYDYSKMFDDLQKIIMEERVDVNAIINENKFAKALKKSFVLSGDSISKAEYETEDAIKWSTERAGLYFRGDAKNIFSQKLYEESQMQRE